MNEALWQVFDRLVLLPDHERDAQLTSIALNPADRNRLDSLLRGFDKPSATYLPAHLQAVVDEYCVAEAELLQDHPPITVNGYRIVRYLGQGATGLAYEVRKTGAAEDSNCYVLKLFWPGQYGEDLRSAEKAVLEHTKGVPGATKDRGSLTVITPNGPRPALVRDMAMGKTLQELIESGSIPLFERLELFQGVCRVVDHAHNVGVIHRDIASRHLYICSGNETVRGLTLAEGADREVSAPSKLHVVLIDYGISFPIGFDPKDFPRAFSIPYASSEQMADPSTATIRSDIYALGVILWEVVEGRSACSLDDINERERQWKPLPPLVCGKGPFAADLSAIITKATAKDPAARYAHASDLSADVQRCLRREPIAARRHTIRYRCVQWMRRAPFQASVSAALLVLVCVNATLYGYTSAKRAKENARAVDNFDRHTQRAAELFQADITDWTPEQRRIAIARISAQWRGEQEDEEDGASIDWLTGTCLSQMGDSERAVDMLTKSAHWYEEQFGSSAIETLFVKAELVPALQAVHRVKDAAKLGKAQLPQLIEKVGEQHPRISSARLNLVGVLLELGENEEANALLQKVQASTTEPAPQAYAKELAARAAENKRDFDLAARLGSGAAAFALDHLGPTHSRTLEIQSNLAAVQTQRARQLSAQGSWAQAAKCLDEAILLEAQTLQGRRTTQGMAHPGTLNTALNLCSMWWERRLLWKNLGSASERTTAQAQILANLNPLCDEIIAECESTPTLKREELCRALTLKALATLSGPNPSASLAIAGRACEIAKLLNPGTSPSELNACAARKLIEERLGKP